MLFPQDGADLGAKKIYVAVMGMTGAGKSSFISLCSDQEVEIGHGLFAHTSTVDVYSFQYDDKTTVCLIDTPGFDDTSRSDTEVLRQVAGWLTKSYSEDIKLSGIIYLHRITDVRMGGTAKKNLVMFKNLCGKNALKNVILVTTMWSEIALEKGDEREAELVATPEFWGWMMGKGSRICRHTGDRQSAMSILKYFVDQNSQVVLDIQDQMVNQDKSLNETSAGIELGHELIREREKFQAELQQVQQDMAKAIKERDEETRDELRELRDEYTSKIESLSKQKDDLQVNMQKLHEEQSRELEQRMRTQEENHRRELEAVAEKHEDALKELRRLALSPSSPKRTGASSSAAEVPGAQVKRQMKTKLEYGTRVAAICGDGYYIIRDGKTTCSRKFSWLERRIPSSASDIFVSLGTGDTVYASWYEGSVDRYCSLYGDTKDNRRNFLSASYPVNLSTFIKKHMKSCSKPCLVAFGPHRSFFVRCWKCDDYDWTLSPLVYSQENLEDVFRKYASVINVCALGGANGAYFVQYKPNNSNVSKRVWNLSGYIGEKTEGYIQTRGPLLACSLNPVVPQEFWLKWETGQITWRGEDLDNVFLDGTYTDSEDEERSRRSLARLRNKAAADGYDGSNDERSLRTENRLPRPLNNVNLKKKLDRPL